MRMLLPAPLRRNAVHGPAIPVHSRWTAHGGLPSTPGNHLRGFTSFISTYSEGHDASFYPMLKKSSLRLDVIKRLQICRNFERGRSLIPAHYGSLHKRLWSASYRERLDFSLEKMQAVQALYGFFDCANIETSACQVMGTGCDRCQERAVQPLQEELKHMDPVEERGVVVPNGGTTRCMCSRGLGVGTREECLPLLT